MKTNLKGFPATLATTDKGFAANAWDLFPGLYIWHKGAYRLVTAVEAVGVAGYRVRMGRFSLKARGSVEVAPF
jgi:hypothetical protein